MDINLIASELLFGRLIAVFFTVLVLRQQLILIKMNRTPTLRSYRWVLFVFALVILVSNFIPIIVDAATLFGFRSAWAVIVYAYSNDVTAILSSISLWLAYLLAARSKARDD